jgi:hypothetical protein
MLYHPDRHEALSPEPWSEARAREAIDAIVRDAQERFAATSYWPWHPKDVEPGDDQTQPPLPLYFGAAGVIWAMRYLQDIGATDRGDRYEACFDDLLRRSRAGLASMPADESASFLIGETPILLMAQADQPNELRADRLATLIDSNKAHPGRELMWGSPGTMLAALFLHERFGGERWAALFRQSAQRLQSELVWSDAHRCHYWTQLLYGRESTYLDAVHGFVATASVLIRGRSLLDADEWTQWQSIIATTIERTATREEGLANWRTQMLGGSTRPHLMQFCHGAPGFIICLADFPDRSLDELLIAAGEATWQAGPLTKGSNLCHGTGGNGYAFLKLFRRTGDERWLERARAFAMHGIRQTWDDRARYGQLRYSLWTGDPGFAIYLWDCIRATPAFPTLDVFYG